MQDCESLEDKMSRIKRQNAELLKRHMEVEADKKKAAKAKALVHTHANSDVNAMTPAERNATLESRSRITDARDLIYSYREAEPTSDRKLSSRLGVNSAKWEPLETRCPQRANIPRPKLESNSRKALVRMLMESNDEDMFKDVEPLNDSTENGDEADHSGPFKHTQDLESSQDELETSDDNVFKNVTSFDDADNEPCELNFDPDMDLTVPPPPIQRSKIYGSGRLSKSRLNDTSNLPDLLPDGAQGSNNYEPEEAYSPLNFPSLQLLAEALNTCQQDQYQPNGQEQTPDYPYDHQGNGWPGVGNFDDTPSEQEPEVSRLSPSGRKKSAIELRMEAVRREKCQRFSRAQYMSQDKSSEVEITFVQNSSNLFLD